MFSSAPMQKISQNQCIFYAKSLNLLFILSLVAAVHVYAFYESLQHLSDFMMEEVPASCLMLCKFFQM